jgi:hypothetical protein
MSKTSTPVTAKEVRAWALENGLQVGTRGHLPGDVIKAYNRGRRRKFQSRNPMSASLQTEG